MASDNQAIPEDFRRLRARIDKTIDRYRQRTPGEEALATLEADIHRLESMVGPTSGQIFLPTKPPHPPRPIDQPAPPPIPKLPETKAFIDARKATLAEIESLELQIKGAEILGQKSGSLKAKLHNLQTSIGKMHRQYIPSQFYQERALAVREHAEHEKHQRTALGLWRQQCAAIDAGYIRNVNAWRIASGKKGVKGTQLRSRIIRRIRDDFNDLRANGVLHPNLRSLPWRFLPPPEPGEAGLARILSDIRKTFNAWKVDEFRIRFAYSLNPSEIYVGRDEFAGYLAFVFPNTQSVLLECPIEGNAAYIFQEDWKILSRLSKTVLLKAHSAQIDRLIHRSTAVWTRGIRRGLGLSRTD